MPALIYPTISKAITSAAFVAVTVPAGVSCNAFSLWTEDGEEYYISSDSIGSDAITVPAGLALSIEHRVATSSTGLTICYAKGSSSTNLVGLLVR